MKYWIKYVAAAIGGTIAGAAYFLPSGLFLTFVTGWLFLIPAAGIALLAYGLREYMKDRKNRILVSIKPGEAMRALARREMELQREKELLLKELSNGVKRE